VGAVRVSSSCFPPHSTRSWYATRSSRTSSTHPRHARRRPGERLWMTAPLLRPTPPSPGCPRYSPAEAGPCRRKPCRRTGEPPTHPMSPVGVVRAAPRPRGNRTGYVIDALSPARSPSQWRSVNSCFVQPGGRFCAPRRRGGPDVMASLNPAALVAPSRHLLWPRRRHPAGRWRARSPRALSRRWRCWYHCAAGIDAAPCGHPAYPSGWRGVRLRGAAAAPGTVHPGLCAGLADFGPLSDRYGRKVILVPGWWRSRSPPRHRRSHPMARSCVRGAQGLLRSAPRRGGSGLHREALPVRWRSTGTALRTSFWWPAYRPRLRAGGCPGLGWRWYWSEDRYWPRCRAWARSSSPTRPRSELGTEVPRGRHAGQATAAPALPGLVDAG
jgi:hypothetical protein